MRPHTAPSWRPSLSAGVPPEPSWTLPTPSWPGGAGLRTKIVPVSTIRAHAGVAGGRRLGVRGRGAVVVRRRGLRESGMEIGWSTKVCITSARIGGRSARADLLGLFRTGVEAKFVADVNLNADRARRGLDDPDGRPSVPDRAQDRRIPGLVAACRPERLQLRVGQQLAVLADPRRGGGPGSQRRSAADPVSTTMVSALLGLPADRLAEQRARGAARPGTGGGHPAGAPMDRCVS